MELKQKIGAVAVRQALALLEKDPQENLPKILKWACRLDPDGVGRLIRMMGPVLEDPDNNWYKLLLSLWELDEGVRKAFFQSFIINATMLGAEKQLAAREKYGCSIPWAILMDPTSACNLRCSGCWAAEYGQTLSLSYETLDDIVRQANSFGVYMFLYTGGEPLMRKKDIIRLCQAHPDCMFLAFTNGTLIDREFCADMLRVKNFVPAISIEGFEEATDSRRGKGTFKKCVQAMDLLRENKLLFGASLCYTRANTEVIGSEEFIDFLIEKGARFSWIFTYIPVGVGAPTELLVTAGQREWMYHQIRAFRRTKPLFTMDFWNDGEYVNGCIAGGRNFLHINANGDIEPCGFIHYSDSNIYQHSLLEAFQRPLFRAYHEGQPFSDNYLRPCPLLDNNGALAKMVHESGAHSTDVAAPEDVDELCAKCRAAAAEWQPVADRLWAAGHHVSRARR